MYEIEILENKNSWIVVNKPPGLSVHNAEDATNLIQELDKLNYKGFSPVNRLDKETSGIMVLSKDKASSAGLQEALSTSNKSKIYYVIVKGSFNKKRKGVYNSPLTNKSEGRKNPAGIKAQRVECLTKYSVIAQTKYLTLLECEIETGRQHQIRKHCILDKHQVIGDKRYGDKKINTLIERKYAFNNMTLHSSSLTFDFEGESYNYNTTIPTSWSPLMSTMLETMINTIETDINNLEEFKKENPTSKEVRKETSLLLNRIESAKKLISENDDLKAKLNNLEQKVSALRS
ncbi:MAG: hypothetical protein BM556_03195 [Bacteriovorax sp. MedPE-SWde]|nr:MAG: hypothetical protein BM556_03195 [Bacteriovorax sp. MedPE-SWde]